MAELNALGNCFVSLNWTTFSNESCSLTPKAKNISQNESVPTLLDMSIIISTFGEPMERLHSTRILNEENKIT